MLFAIPIETKPQETRHAPSDLHYDQWLWPGTAVRSCVSTGISWSGSREGRVVIQCVCVCVCHCLLLHVYIVNILYEYRMPCFSLIACQVSAQASRW